MKVDYYINGVSFRSLGVKVSASSGLIDSLKIKEPAKASWPDQHGEVVDLAAPRYQSRAIELSCYIKADSSTAFILAVQTFVAAFQKSGLQQLRVEVDDGVVTRKPLLYLVYLADEVSITKKWSQANLVGTFTLKLIEPEPVKRIYKFVAVSPGALEVTMTVTSTEPVNVYWGDGNNDLDVTTSSLEISNTYAAAGTYYIVVTGVIENITGIVTTATEVWSRL